ncbi:MAG: branched-chain amino acid ABC transporter ATP-binding protein/permease [Actinobacteria bacterium]|nr:branched-chain amino acid ABC transporter ATP-binding protein/permease [Actinomycetota bacterium]
MRARSAALVRFGWVLPLAIAAVVCLLPWLGTEVQFQREVMLAAMYGLLVAGFNLSFGYGGQLAIGQVAVFAGGAYTTAILYKHGVSELAIAIVASMVVAALLGFITGLPGLRFSSWAVALVAFFLVMAIPNVVQIFAKQTGGVIGIPGILGPHLFGQALSAEAFFVAVIVLSALCLLLLRNLVESRYGHSLLILKQGAPLARSLGLSSFRLRLSAYVIAGLPAGLAGALYAYYATFVQADIFGFSLVTLLLAASIIGGVNSMWAAPLAAAILVIGPEQASSFNKYSVLVYGIILMLAGAGFSIGLAGVGRKLLARFGLHPGSVAEEQSIAAHAGEAPADLRIAGEPLVTHDVAKRFEGVEALKGVDFEAKPGEVTAIIGANGAGKTTLLNAISGHISADRGDVLLGERQISALRTDQIAKAGVARTFQTPQIPESLTVLEIAASSRISRRWMPTAAIALRSPGFRRLRREDNEAARAALEFVGLAEQADMPAESLPLGMRRMLEVARSIAAEPSVILLDEPAAGLDPEAIEYLRAVLVRMRDAGGTVVLIEHNVNFVMEVADSVYVMNLGEVIANAAPEEVRQDERVIASYLGRRAAVAGPAAPAGPPTGPGSMEVSDAR